MVVLTELRNHRVADVFFLVCDGLKGLPDSVNAVWPATIVQTSSVHIGAGGRVPLVTCAAPVRTCANQLPSRPDADLSGRGGGGPCICQREQRHVSAEMRFR
jgi:hypothetical protein